MKGNPIHILVTPLDWGLGHATRCIPVIRILIERGCKVSIASNGYALRLLQQEFPHLSFFQLPSYRPTYVANGSLIRSLLIQIPKFACAIWNEHRQIKKMIRNQRIDAIISDNRYGCYHHSVKSIFITHQLTILLESRFGWFARIANYVNQCMINRFDHCWIPDMPAHILSGDLSKPLHAKCQMVGILSRFKLNENKERIKKKWKILAVVSGPEAQRSLFESILRNQLNQINEPSLLVKGLPSNTSIFQTNGHLHEVNYLNAAQLQSALETAELVVCRSGYSSIMDMAILTQRFCIMIPTPGQPEQEYLATKLNTEQFIFSVPQNKFELKLAMQEVISRKGFASLSSPALLPKAIDDLLNSIQCI